MGESVPSVQIADEPALSASLKLNLMTAERRSSSRHAGKTRPFYGSPEKKISGNTNISKPVVKKMKLNVGKAKEDKEDLVKLRNKEVSDPPTILFSAEAVDAGVDGCEEKVVSEGVANDENVADSGGKSADQRVRETIRLFNTHYLQLVQEEELRCRRANTDVISTCKDVNSKRKKSSEEDEKRSAKRRPDLKRKKSREEDEKRSAKRPDLKAITKMRETKTVLYPTKRFGALSGVDVGHQFYSRAEMVVVGLHSHWLNGIDFMGQTYAKLEEYKSKNYVFPLATSIVLSGIYEDDVDDSEDIVYTGQGGNDLLGCKHQISDQTMLRGNLALKNNMEHSVPVRVIRGHGCASSYTGKVYTYDGLYKVIKYWAEKGVSGFTVFKYRLRRMEGQGVLTTNQVLYVKAEAPKSLSDLRGLVCEDISGGQENIKVPASNVVDDPPIPPMGYEYRKSIQVAEGVSLPTTANGCNCKGSCIDPRICACAQLNGSDFPYVSKDGGRLIEAKAVVYECGPKCGCGPGCVNRTSQQGLKYRLEVFRTSNKGWAVRSWDFIPAGAPICEYTGRLMPTNDLDKVENVSGNNFIFEIDCLQTMKGIDGRESRSGGSTLLSSLDKTECVPEYCIDAGPVGGVARFINHSCEPNLFVQCVLSAHHDVKLARVVLFAADSIPPLQELTYDYGYVLGSVTGPDGKIKEMPCYCGAKLCRKRLY